MGFFVVVVVVVFCCCLYGFIPFFLYFSSVLILSAVRLQSLVRSFSLLFIDLSQLQQHQSGIQETSIQTLSSSLMAPNSPLIHTIVGALSQELTSFNQQYAAYYINSYDIHLLPYPMPLSQSICIGFKMLLKRFVFLSLTLI